MKHCITRRLFLKLFALWTFFLSLSPLYFKRAYGKIEQRNWKDKVTVSNLTPENYLGLDSDGFSRVYLAQYGTPEENLGKVIEMMGGISKIIGENDIVIIKPNAMWSNFRITNTNAIKKFIELVLNLPGFSGEIIVAENNHQREDNSRGWTTTERNGDFNLNELIEYFNKKGQLNVTKYHWHDAGPNPWPRDGGAGWGRKVTGPLEGDGYVWRNDLVYISPESQKCMMTYPIFTSTYSGVTIDLKNGPWKNGNYLNNPLKLINFSALNHHTSYAGVTASVKNMMGVVDMTCGYPGTEPKGFYNIHWVGYENFIHLVSSRVRDLFNDIGLKSLGKFINKNFVPLGTFNFEYAGGALGYWLRTIRFPNLNIITAEWVGYGGRYDITRSKKCKTILASKDPVALDYCAAKHILLPLMKTVNMGDTYCSLHDPDNLDGSFGKFLEHCHYQGIGNLDLDLIKLHSHNFKSS